MRRLSQPDLDHLPRHIPFVSGLRDVETFVALHAQQQRAQAPRDGLAELGLADNRADTLLSHMAKDKKVRDGAITLILPRCIGDCFEMRNAPVDQLREFLAAAA